MAESELICTTSYVELFVRRISEPSLLAVFLRFLFTETCDDKNIVDQVRLGILKVFSNFGSKIPRLTIFDFKLKARKS